MIVVVRRWWRHVLHRNNPLLPLKLDADQIQQTLPPSVQNRLHDEGVARPNIISALRTHASLGESVFATGDAHAMLVLDAWERMIWFW